MERVEWWRQENSDPEAAEIESKALFRALAEGASDLDETPEASEDHLSVLALLLDTVLRAADEADESAADA